MRKPRRHMGSCQNYGPFLGTLKDRCRIRIGTPKGTMILTTTHMVSTASAVSEGSFTSRFYRYWAHGFYGL